MRKPNLEEKEKLNLIRWKLFSMLERIDEQESIDYHQ